MNYSIKNKYTKKKISNRVRCTLNPQVYALLYIAFYTFKIWYFTYRIFSERHITYSDPKLVTKSDEISV